MKRIILMIVVALFATVVFAQTKTELKPTELSKQITDWMTTNVKTYSIVKAFKVDSKGVITYDVMATKGTDKRLFVFDKDGKFVKKGDQETKETFKNTQEKKPLPPTKAPATQEKKFEPKK